MGNSWFQFKKFKVEQGRSAMKVCTDSCLFAATIARLAAEGEIGEEPLQILDIGAGTGLLSLMMAQVFSKAEISAVELHPGSAADCRLNFEQSPWVGRLNLREGDFGEMKFLPERKFDLIICNPPFFISHLESPDQNRNAAMHASSGSIEKWLDLMAECLKPEGKICLLLSDDAGRKINLQVENQRLYLHQEIRMLRQPDKVWRRIFLFSHQQADALKQTDQLVLDEKGKLTNEARQLMEDFYLS